MTGITRFLRTAVVALGSAVLAPLHAAPASAASSTGWAVDGTQTASYWVGSNDASHVVPMACTAATCTVTLPALGTFAAGTQLVVENVSNAGAAPILPVGTPTRNTSCSSNCATATSTYTVTAQHDLLVVEISACGGSGCATTPAPQVTGVTDSLGDTCGFVVRETSSGSAGDEEIWDCPNTVATGADTFTVTTNIAAYYTTAAISEYAGAALAAPAEVANAAAGTSTTPAVSTNGWPSERGDLIFGAIIQPGTWPLPVQPVVSSAAYSYESNNPWPSEYQLTNGTAQYTLNWTQPSGATPSWGAVIAAFKPANPISVVKLCPGSGSSIVHAPTSLGCALLVPGAPAMVTVNGAGDYFVQTSAPQQGIGAIDDATASFTPSLLNCYETTALLNYLTPVVVTIPSTLPPGCTLNFIQTGSQAAQVEAGSGLALASYNGNAHTGGQFAPSFVAIGGNGGIAYFGGTTAP